MANKTAQRQMAVCAFRVAGRQPELWWPATGLCQPAVIYDQTRDGRTVLPLALEPFESVFVVFPVEQGAEPERIVKLERDGQALLQAAWPPQKAGQTATGQPAGAPHSARQAGKAGPGGSSRVGESERAEQVAAELEIRRDRHGRLQLSITHAGEYRLTTASGKVLALRFGPLPAPREVAGPWTLRFSPGWGAPPKLVLAKLLSWSEHPEPGVRYHSGTGLYSIKFRIEPQWLAPGQGVLLELGRVEVVAEVKLNGRPLDTLWWPPFRVDITEVARPGENVLEVAVTNLWVNRLIGDEQLPEDSDRNPNGTLKAWPDWLKAGKPSPTGRYTFTTWRLWSKEDPLVPSGLLGPVRLIPYRTGAAKLR